MKNGIKRDDLMSELKPEPWYPHLLGFIIPLAVLWGNYVGGYWTWGGIILALGIYPLLDQLFGESETPRPSSEDGLPHEIIL